MSITTRGTKGFFIWLKRAMPDVYAEVRKDFSQARQVSGLGIVATSDPVALSTEAPATRTLSQTIADIANVVAQGYLTREQAKAQQKVLDYQLDRARQGLAPDPAYENYRAPGASVSVGMSEDTKQLFLYGAGFIALLFVGSKLMK